MVVVAGNHDVHAEVAVAGRQLLDPTLEGDVDRAVDVRGRADRRAVLPDGRAPLDRLALEAARRRTPAGVARELDRRSGGLGVEVVVPNVDLILVAAGAVRGHRVDPRLVLLRAVDEHGHRRQRERVRGAQDVQVRGRVVEDPGIEGAATRAEADRDVGRAGAAGNDRAQRPGRARVRGDVDRRVVAVIGSSVNAVATICSGCSGLTAMFGSESCSASPLSDLGIMLTICSVIAGPLARRRRAGGCPGGRTGQRAGTGPAARALDRRCGATATRRPDPPSAWARREP